MLFILCGGKLNEDIAAISVIVEHIFYPAELTDYSAEPVLQRLHRLIAPRRRLMPTAFAAFIFIFHSVISRFCL